MNNTIGKIVKENLINLACEDKLPLDLNELEISDITKGLDDYLFIMWEKDDIEFAAEAENVELSDQDIKDIMEYLRNNHDATQGINWETISWAITRIKADE